MLVRLRSISIALLGLVTAVSLGLIFFISQLGFPGVFSAPIPGSPSEAGTVQDAVAVGQGTDAGSSAPAVHGLRSAGVTVGFGHARHAAGTAAHPSLGGSHKLLSAAGDGPNSALADTPSAPASQPTSSQPPAAASPAPGPVEGAPTPSPAAQAKQHSDTQPKSNGTTQVKPKDDADGKPVATSVGKATSDQASDVADGPSAPSTSTESSSSKSRRDQSTSTKAAAPLPATATPVKDVPAATSEAAAKEAADAGRSGGPSH